MHKQCARIQCTVCTQSDDLADTTYKYETQYGGNSSDIYNGVGDKNLIALTGMVP